jgi:hypothetical protein
MRMRIYCWIGVSVYLVLSASDLMMTVSLLKSDREAYESNPVAAACLQQYGWPGLVVYKSSAAFLTVFAVVFLVRIRPAIGAGVITFGCLVLLSVTTYSRQLIQESEQHAQREQEARWPIVRNQFAESQ